MGGGVELSKILEIQFELVALEAEYTLVNEYFLINIFDKVYFIGMDIPSALQRYLF